MFIADVMFRGQKLVEVSYGGEELITEYRLSLAFLFLFDEVETDNG